MSVVTPSYNQGRFLEETIRSVLLQGYPDFEYFIIDGGSADESLEIIRRYEPWLTYWTSEPDRGQSDAINKGWARATGDVVAYLNSDDCYLTGAVAKVAQRFFEDPNLGMVYGTALIVDEFGELLREWQAQPFDLKAMLAIGNMVPQPAAFFSKSVLHTLGYLNENWHLIMDYEFCTRVGTRFPAACIPDALARFRDHAASKSRSRFQQMAEELIEFFKSYSTDQIAQRDLQVIKQTAMSRVHYELAFAYLAQEHKDGAKVIAHLLKSIALQPGFALGRSRLTAHVAKELLSGPFRAAAGQVIDIAKKRGSWEAR